MGEGDICSPLAGAYKEGERKTRRTEKENETMSENVDSRNEVEIDLAKYDKLINNLHDKEKEIARMKADAEAQKKAIGPRKKRRVLDIFLDDNDVNEKAIVGFASFSMMVAFGIVDLITSYAGMDFTISDTIYTSFVVVTLGCFGIAEAGKAFSGK